jgi:hypothetical protein
MGQAHSYLATLSDERAIATWRLMAGAENCLRHRAQPFSGRFCSITGTHHRGQLLVDLRLLNVPPSVYCPTADENPFCGCVVRSCRGVTPDEEYLTVLRMAQRLGSLDRFRTPPIALTSHDPARWDTRRALLDRRYPTSPFHIVVLFDVTLASSMSRRGPKCRTRMLPNNRSRGSNVTPAEITRSRAPGIRLPAG